MTKLERVEQLCKEKGITFYRLAKDIGISRQALSLWKRGETKCLSVLNLIRIARYFGLPHDALLDKKKES